MEGNFIYPDNATLDWTENIEYYKKNRYGYLPNF